MEFEENGTVKPTQDQINAGISRRKAMASRQLGFEDGDLRPLAGLYGWLRIALFVFIGAEILLSVFGVALGVTGGSLGFRFDDPALVNIYSAAFFVGIGYILIFLVCAFATCRWTYRAMKNLHTAYNPVAEMSPVWATFSYFVPIVNLFVPVTGMSQIYHGSAAEVGDDSETGSPIGLWWGAYLVSSLLGNISGRLPNYNMTTAGLDCLSGVLSLVAVYQLLRITRETTNRQARMAHGGIADTFA